MRLKKIIDRLLSSGEEIFDDLTSFFDKYPNFTSKERMAMGKKNVEKMLAAAKTNRD